MNKVRLFSHYSTSTELERKINEMSRYFEILSVSLSTETAGYSVYFNAAVVYRENIDE